MGSNTSSNHSNPTATPAERTAATPADQTSRGGLESLPCVACGAPELVSGD